MLDKLIVLYTFIITLNPVIKLYVTADFKKNVTSVTPSRVQNTFQSSVIEAEDKWQPIIQTHYWLAAPTTLTPVLSVSTKPTRDSSLWLSRNIRNDLANNSKHRDNINQQTYHNYAKNHHYNENYSKRHIKTTTSTASSPTPFLFFPLSSSSPLSQLINNNKLRSHSKTSRGKTQLNFHQQQQQVYPLNKVETLYSKIQIPKDTITQAQERQQQTLPLAHQAKYKKNLISSQLNLNQLKHHTTPSSSISYWQYLQQPQHGSKHIISQTPKLNTTYIISNVKTTTFCKPNESVKENVKNSSSIILAKTLNSFASNENLIDNEITNTNKPQHHNHYHYTHLHHSGFKSVKTSNAADENLTNANKSNSIDTKAAAAADNEENLKLLLLRKTLEVAQEFYDNIQYLILSDKHNNFASSKSNNYATSDNDYDMHSNEDKTNDNNDLQILNSLPYQQPHTATTAAMDDLFNMQNMLLPSASIGEVQGRRRHIEKDTMKYPSSQNTSQMENAAVKAIKIIDTQATDRLWNLSTTDQTSTHSSPLAPSLTASTTKGITAFSSGRKVKKVKKKFKKFLLPLVLAYKLKFLTLIPLLIAGLTLLVGTTGLAGFFFALFTAVMSLKSDGRNAIVVKKY